MKENFYVGCDISKASIDVCVHHEGHPARSKQFPNSAMGHEQLIEWITLAKARVRLVMEATGSYSIDSTPCRSNCDGTMSPKGDLKSPGLQKSMDKSPPRILALE